MGAFFKLFLLLAVFYLASEVKLSTSLYHYEENEIELTFPVWQTDNPWYYMKWNPAKQEFEQKLGILEREA
ncbi:hypothetical protein [Oceanimonas doudoroffii]|uniref:Uncharacterized protein n=1 Tax=Oceanimonas doudoroffii TaxID=84158 RepID=A0A233RJE3_9GAMM|nr:hypothetical protein [Oceanimonas doudoroffii]OXY83514.1 hypothetical protein B6S08_08525 [Oceanimonas doudoroffii]